MNLSPNFSPADTSPSGQQALALLTQYGIYALFWASAHPFVAAAIVIIPAVNAWLYYYTHKANEYSIQRPFPYKGEPFTGTRSYIIKQVKIAIQNTKHQLRTPQPDEREAILRANDTQLDLMREKLNELETLLKGLLDPNRSFDYYISREKIPKADLTGTAYAFLHTAVLSASVAALASACGAWVLAACVLGAVALPEIRKLYALDYIEEKATANACSTILLAGAIGGLPAAKVVAVVEALAFATTFSDKTKCFASVVDNLNSFIAPSTSFVEAYNLATGKPGGSVTFDR